MNTNSNNCHQNGLSQSTVLKEGGGKLPAPFINSTVIGKKPKAYDLVSEIDVEGLN